MNQYVKIFFKINLKVIGIGAIFFPILYFIGMPSLHAQNLCISLDTTWLAGRSKETYMFIKKSDTLQLSACKFYVSNLQLFDHTKSVIQSYKEPILIDLLDSGYYCMNLMGDNNKVRYLEFTLGLDSITNSNASFVGDLDPIHGMYWTWQSGFIMIKIEGSSTESKSKNGSFTFHIGGFQNNQNASRKMNFELSDSGQIHLTLDIMQCLTELFSHSIFHTMSPGKDAMRCSDVIQSSFFLDK